MEKTYLVWLLVAGLVGMLGGYDSSAAGYRPYIRSVPWAIVALMCFLGLIGALPLVS